MKILICFKRLEKTPARAELDEKIHRKSQKLETLVPGASQAKWTCWKANGKYFTEVSLHGPRMQFHARAQGDSLLNGLDQVVDKIERQVIKRKESSKKHIRKRGNVIFMKFSQQQTATWPLDLAEDKEVEAS